MNPVLIVDDNEDVIWVLEDILSPLYPVVTAGSVFEAMSILRRTPVSLVITDIRMPHADGSLLIEHLREKDPNLPIIVITGYMNLLGNEGVIARKMANHILEKPFHADHLVMLVSDLLNCPSLKRRCELPIESDGPETPISAIDRLERLKPPLGR